MAATLPSAKITVNHAHDPRLHDCPTIWVYTRLTPRVAGQPALRISMRSRFVIDMPVFTIDKLSARQDFDSI